MPHKNRPYRLEPYNPTWAEMFRTIQAEVSPLFGTNLVSVEHVGSTAIAKADMYAKPNIDLCVVVKDLDLIPELYPLFIDHGYTPLGREYVGDGDEYIVKDDPVDGRRLVSIHIYPVGHPKPAEYRIFRDYLIQNDQDRARYVALKQQLHKAHGTEYSKYDSGKTELIDELKANAARWAAAKE